MAGRVFERKRRQMPCTITLDGRNHGGLILDVSPGGLYVQSSAKIKPGDRLDIQLTIPGAQGRQQLQVEVVRKVVVPARLLKVAHGGVGVRIINAPEAYYHYMDALGITAEAGKSKIERLENQRAEASAEPPVGDVETEPRVTDQLPAPPLRFRVRVKQSNGPRSRTLRIAADSEDDARRFALEEVGEGWVALDVERADDD